MTGKATEEIRRRRKESKKHRKQESKDGISLLGATKRLLWVFIPGVATILAAYYFFRPSIEVETPSSSRESAYNLFDRPFVIRNNSVLFSVSDVHATCGVRRIWRGTATAPSAEEYNATADYVPAIPQLGPGERHSVPCSSGTTSSKPIVRADVVIALDYYRPWFFLGHTDVHQSYRAVIEADGLAYWTPYVELH